MNPIIVPPGYQQPQNPTSLEQLLEIKKHVQALERRMSILESDRNKQAALLDRFIKQAKKTIHTMERELTNHIMNTPERR